MENSFGLGGMPWTPNGPPTKRNIFGEWEKSIPKRKFACGIANVTKLMLLCEKFEISRHSIWFRIVQRETLVMDI